MKKIITEICCTMMIFGAAFAVNRADAAITSITPQRNVGVFEKNDDVVFTAASNGTQAENVVVKVKDIDGNEVCSKNFSVAAESKLNLGKFPVGWYRVYVYNTAGKSAYDEYTAFSVNEPYAERTVYKNSPFALDTRVIEYGGDVEKYAEAYKLAGITQVRERGYFKYNYNGTSTLDKGIDAYHKNGIDVLNVWSQTKESNWDKDLFEVYNWQKTAAQNLSGKVNAWEIINEPDMVSGLPTDLYAAYLKAAAMGVYDGDANALKSFGAVCHATSPFAEVLMQNGVMDYVDTYNVHTHRDGATSVLYQTLEKKIITDGRIKSTVYGGGSEMWATESGLRLTYNSDGIPSDNTLKNQAAFMITSYMESIASSGTDKHFFFLGTHYLENSKEYGIFSESEMPFPAYSALSALTYHLGEGKFLGELRIVRDDADGYVFDTGSGWAVVLCNKNNKSANIQIDTAESATVIDLVGGRTQRIPNRGHNLINVPVKNTPVIVVLGDKKARYSKKDFLYNKERKDISDTERLVIQPIWQDDIQVKDGRYILEQGKTYNIKAKVYNFAQKMLVGTLKFNATNQIDNISVTSKSYRIASGNVLEIPLTITVGEDAMPLSEGFFEIGGTKCTPAVAAFMISDANIASVIQSKKQIPNFNKNWQKNSSANSSTVSQYSSGVKVSGTWNQLSSAWIYPYVNVSQDASGYDGLYFTACMDSVGSVESGKFNFNVYVNGKLASAGVVGKTAATLYVPWSRFDDLDISNITKINVGFTSGGSSGTMSYTVTDLGFYKTVAQSPSYDKPEIAINLEDKQIWCVGNQPEIVEADISGELTDLKVYVNYKEYTNFTVDGSKISIDISELGDGAHNIIVTGRDAYNYAVRDEVGFYLRKVDEWYPRGTFF